MKWATERENSAAERLDLFVFRMGIAKTGFSGVLISDTSDNKIDFDDRRVIHWTLCSLLD